MQEGIGRGGYRILATVFLGVGLLGLASLIVAAVRAPSTAALVLGICLTAVALAVLFVLALVGLAKRGGAPPAPAGLPPQRHLDVEYLDAEDAPEEVDDAPREPVPVQPNRNLTRDTKGWPQRKGPSGVTRGEARKAAGAKPAIPIEFKATAARVVPMESARAPLEPPTVLAREVARNAKVPEGMAKGQCGTCDAILLAPKVRPLKLRCPKCQKVTALS